MMLMTRKLWMDKPDMSDAELFAGWLNEPEVVKYSEQRHKKHTRDTQLDYWRSSATTEPNVVYTIHLAYQEMPIGSISIQIDTINNVADVGIMIGDRAMWGSGYGYEAWECVCNYLFIEKKIRKIEAGCMLPNIAMRRICEKYGMREEGIKTGHFMLDGKPTDMIMYGSFMP